jgi:hypothetical protein
VKQTKQNNLKFLRTQEKKLIRKKRNLKQEHNEKKKKNTNTMKNNAKCRMKQSGAQTTCALLFLWKECFQKIIVERMCHLDTLASLNLKPNL